MKRREVERNTESSHHICTYLQQTMKTGGEGFPKGRPDRVMYQEITISALAFLMPLPLSSSVSTAGEALKLKLDCSLTNDKRMYRTKPYTDVIIGHDDQQRRRRIEGKKNKAACYRCHSHRHYHQHLRQ